jgi:hypothetical protein
MGLKLLLRDHLNGITFLPNTMITYQAVEKLLVGHTHTHTHTHIYIYIYLFIYTYIHTDTQTDDLISVLSFLESKLIKWSGWNEKQQKNLCW